MFSVLNLDHPSLGQAKAATYGCPWQPAPQPGQPSAYAVEYDPTLNCMHDARGNTVCSDGMHYPPGCPHTPPDQYFTPGITPDITNAQGMIEGQIPQPRAAGSAPAAPSAAASTTAPSAAASTPTSPALLVGAGVLGTLALATGAYFLFLKK